ncbi:MAG: phosphoglycerate kinase [Ruminococcaceae bacterium]|nr:phosphoglycerate kinase [Oscillospiraceae bacterium]
MEIKMLPLERFDYQGKNVLLRLDINSPVDPVTKRIVSDNRIKKSVPTVKYLLEQGAKLSIIAHQGDTLDYQNLIPLAEHAERLSQLLGVKVAYIDDVCGPAAQNAIKALQPGEAVLLGNLRYLAEEVTAFEKDVKLTPPEMLSTWLVRSLAPLHEVYVNDAFSAAHRNHPSMVAFQELLPTAGGRIMYDEYAALSRVMSGPARPSVFFLGGAKISDAFGMMGTVLAKGTADYILTAGVTGMIMLMASGHETGERFENFLRDKDLLAFVEPARKLLADFPEKIHFPSDVVCEVEGVKSVATAADFPVKGALYPDIGPETIKTYTEYLQKAGTIFVNGPAGVYENPDFAEGTKAIWQAIAEAPGYSVIGGGDTVSAAGRFIDLKKISYVCTAGGAMVNFLSGKKLALIQAMEKAYERDRL